MRYAGRSCRSCHLFECLVSSARKFVPTERQGNEYTDGVVTLGIRIIGVPETPMLIAGPGRPPQGAFLPCCQN